MDSMLARSLRMRLKALALLSGSVIAALAAFGSAQAQICPNDPYCPRSLNGYRYPFQQHSALNFDQVWRPPVITGQQIRRDWFDAAGSPFRWDRGPMTAVGTPQVLTNPYGTGDPFHSPRLPMTLPRP